jgi:hypothetical protein|tara:strand:- start:66 stop:311 length:246 start_codon:yes stop_codon:yes gene_type:complete
MSDIKKLEKEIKDNLFQLSKDELKIIIRHIQSMINKQYMGEEIKSVDNKLENTLDFIRDDICELNNKISDICVKLDVQEQD